MPLAPAGVALPGLCRVNRAEVARLRGEWAEAEAEATRATEELTRFDPMAAEGYYEMGEAGGGSATCGRGECFARAQGLGFDPQPGLALLRPRTGTSRLRGPRSDSR